MSGGGSAAVDVFAFPDGVTGARQRCDVDRTRRARITGAR